MQRQTASARCARPQNKVNLLQRPLTPHRKNGNAPHALLLIQRLIQSARSVKHLSQWLLRQLTSLQLSSSKKRRKKQSLRQNSPLSKRMLKKIKVFLLIQYVLNQSMPKIKMQQTRNKNKRTKLLPLRTTPRRLNRVSKRRLRNLN